MGLLLMMNLWACNQEEFLENEIVDQGQNTDLLARGFYADLYTIAEGWDMSADYYLRAIVNEMFQGEYMMYYQVLLRLDETFSEKISYIFIDDHLFSLGAYDPIRNDMFFRSVYDIYEAFPEEYIHFLQDLCYGISLFGFYVNDAILLEFEAKVLRDICDGERYCDLYTGMGRYHPGSYIRWINEIRDLMAGMPFELIEEGYDGISYYDFLEDYAAYIGNTVPGGRDVPQLLQFAFSGEWRN